MRKSKKRDADKQKGKGPAIPQLTEAAVKEMFPQKIFDRGLDYFKQRAVFNIYAFGKTIQASVRGRGSLLYKVKIEFRKSGLKEEPVCSCPYGEEFLGPCKHIAATLLTLVKKPETVIEAKSLSELIKGLDKSSLKKLLTAVVEAESSLRPLVENFVEEWKKTSASKKKAKAAAPGRHTNEVIDLIRGAAAETLFPEDHCCHDWDYDPAEPAYEAIAEVEELILKACRLLNRGKGEKVINTLLEIAEGYIQEWQSLSHITCDSDAPFMELDNGFAEALLSAEISKSARRSLEKAVTAWIPDLKAKEVEYPFSKTALALKEGWSDKSLLKRLNGKVGYGKARPQEEPSSWRDSPERGLSKIRLKILKKKKRFQEYMNLAWAEALIMDFIFMKIERGRFQDALKAAKERLEKERDIYEVCKKLKEANAVKEALEAGYIGLEHPDHSSDLGDIVSDLASKGENSHPALMAAKKTFFKSPSFKRYKRILSAAKRISLLEEKEAKAACLKALRKEDERGGMAKAEILIHEGFFEEAIKDAVFFEDKTRLFVIRQALERKPDWVVQEALRRARALIEEPGRTKYYSQAVEWLKWVQKAAPKNGPGNWSYFLTQIKADYYRRRNLMSLLNKTFDTTARV